MIKFHLKRKTTGTKLAIMTFILLVPVLISYFSTFKFYKYWSRILIEQPLDVNLNAVQKMVDNYCGLTYYFNFLFSNDILLVFTIIFMLFVTYFVANNVIEDLKSAYGNVIVTRVDYGKYFLSNLLSTVLFSFIFLFLFFTILYFVSYIFAGKADFTSDLSSIYGLDKIDDNMLNFYAVAMFQVFQIFITASLIVASGTTLSVVIKNKYVLQMFPIIYFVGSGIIAEIIMAFSENLGIKILPFAINKRLNFLQTSFFQLDEVKNIYQINYASPLTFIIVMSIIILVVGGLNISKYRKDYL